LIRELYPTIIEGSKTLHPPLRYIGEYQTHETEPARDNQRLKVQLEISYDNSDKEKIDGFTCALKDLLDSFHREAKVDVVRSCGHTETHILEGAKDSIIKQKCSLAASCCDDCNYIDDYEG
jgi:hypothetical protein